MKIFKTTLLVLIAAGVVRVAIIGNSIAKLAREKHELEQVVGRFDRLDANESQVAFEETKNPFHFRWHVRNQPILFLGCQFGAHEKRWSWSTSDGIFSYHHPEAMIPIRSQSLFVDFQIDHVNLHFSGISDRLLKLNLAPELLAFVESNWSKLDFEIAGLESTETGDNRKDLQLLSVKIPQEVIDSMTDAKRVKLLAEFENGIVLQFVVDSMR